MKSECGSEVRNISSLLAKWKFCCKFKTKFNLAKVAVCFSSH